MKIAAYSGYENVFGCDLFFEEKEALYSRDKKNAKGYDKWLDRQLRFLDTTGLDVLNNHKQAFEKLSGHENLYSITRREFSGNPRILFFTVVEEGEPDTFVLLTAFSEISNGSYRRAIGVANERRKQIVALINEEDDIDEFSKED